MSRAKLTFHQTELAAPFLVQISRCGDSSRHGEQILSSDSPHGNGPGDRRSSHISVSNNKGSFLIGNVS